MHLTQQVRVRYGNQLLYKQAVYLANTRDILNQCAPHTAGYCNHLFIHQVDLCYNIIPGEKE